MVLYRLCCNTIQLGIKFVDYFLGYRMPEYTFGKGSLEKLPQILKEKEAGKVLVVTEAGLVELGFAKRLTDLLEKAGIDYAIYSGAEKNPTSNNVEDAFKEYREKGCKSVVALGGGSPMDCAKAVCARAVHPHLSVRHLQGILRVHKKIPLIVAIPTTSGTGSETTVAAVITDSKTRRKAAINDPVLIPRYAIGMDALSHAVESYTNHMYNTKTEDLLARKAVQLIYDNLYKAYLDGSDMRARENMQIAALYAGRAFTRGCVGYVHAIGHTLGGLYGVPHGLAMAILLPHVMRAFGPAVHGRLAELASVCGMTGASDAEKAEKFISWIEEMNREMGIPDYLDMIKDEDIEQMITWAMREANPLYPTPVLWGRKELREFIASVRK